MATARWNRCGIYDWGRTDVYCPHFLCYKTWTKYPLSIVESTTHGPWVHCWPKLHLWGFDGAWLQSFRQGGNNGPRVHWSITKRNILIPVSSWKEYASIPYSVIDLCFVCTDRVTATAFGLQSIRDAARFPIQTAIWGSYCGCEYWMCTMWSFFSQLVPISVECIWQKTFQGYLVHDFYLNNSAVVGAFRNTWKEKVSVRWRSNKWHG